MYKEYKSLDLSAIDKEMLAFWEEQRSLKKVWNKEILQIALYFMRDLHQRTENLVFTT